MNKIELIKEISTIEDSKLLVSLLVLISQNLEINTISETARQENKTPRGIIISNNYYKLEIGKQTFAVKGLKDNNLPF